VEIIADEDSHPTLQLILSGDH